MKPSHLIADMNIFLHSIYEFYHMTKAEPYKYDQLQRCVDRLEQIKASDKTEYARLLVIDRKLFQSLLPHMGNPEYFRLCALLSKVIDSARITLTSKPLLQK